MKLSEALEKYGNIEIDIPMQEVDRDKMKAQLLSLIGKVSNKINRLIDEKGYLLLSKEYRTHLIKDKFDKVHLVDFSNDNIFNITSDYDIFVNILYYATNSEYCLDSGEDLDYLVNIFEEQEELDDLVADVELFLGEL